jgi:hypothetical protein
VLRNSHRGLEPPRGGPVPHVWKPDPQGACAPGPASGARTSLPSEEEVRCRHAPLRKRLLSQLCHVSGGSQPSTGRQPNYRIKCG